jgi:hypothetical protein
VRRSLSGSLEAQQCLEWNVMDVIKCLCCLRVVLSFVLTPSLAFSLLLMADALSHSYSSTSSFPLPHSNTHSVLFLPSPLPPQPGVTAELYTNASLSIQRDMPELYARIRPEIRFAHEAFFIQDESEIRR